MSDKFYSHWQPVTSDLPTRHFLGQDHAIADQIATRAGVGANSDTTSPIVATELPNEIIPLYVRQFPLYDLIRKVPANGLSHTYLQQTSFTQTTDPNTIPETGVVNDDHNTYLRRTTNIAIFAIRRSNSFKAQFAGAAAGGASADLFGGEVNAGVMTLARDAQNETLRYQTTISGASTVTDPNGKYDANGFNGLRYLLNNETPPENTVLCDISAPWSDQRVLKAVRRMVNGLYDKGGMVNLLIANTTGSEAMFEDQVAQTRYIKDSAKMEIAPGMSVTAISTDQGLIPVLVVPGNSVGQYIINDTQQTPQPHTYQDIIAVDTNRMTMPYLGSPKPSVIRIPVGVGGQIVEMAIPYFMIGLACMAPSNSLGRVQLKMT